MTRRCYVLFRSIEVAGFRRLLHVDVEFANGLTVVAGDNEAGKSSLHDALVRGLYGFSKSERRKIDGQSVLDRCRPWLVGAQWYGLRLQLDDARFEDEVLGRIEISWQFEEHKVSVRHRDSGEDFTSSVCGKNRDVFLGQKLLGLEASDFLDICALRQVEIAAVGASATLKQALQSAVAKRGGGNVDDAKERLTEAGRKLGLRAQTLSANPRGALDQLETTRRLRESALADAKQIRVDLDELAAALAAAKREHAEVARKEADLSATVMRSRLVDLRRTIDRANELETIAARIVDEPDVDSESVAALRRDLDALASEQEALEQLGRDLAGTEGRVAEARIASATLTIEIQALTPFEAVDPSRLANVTTLWHELETARREPVPVRSQRRGAQRTWLLSAAAVVAVASVTAAVTVAPAAAAGIFVAAIVAFLGLRQRAARPLPEQSTRDPAGAESRLVAELDAANAPDAPDIGQRAQAYVTSCERRARLMEVRVRHGELDREIQLLQAPLPERERRTAAVARLAASIEILRAQLGLEAATPTEIAAALDALEQRRRDAAEQIQVVATARKQREVLLENSTLERLESDAATLNERLEAEGRVNGEVGDVGDLETRLARLSNQRHEVQIQVEKLATSLETQEAGAPDPVEIEVELALVRQRIETIEAHRAALRIALDTLEAAAAETYRLYAPPLNSALVEHLPRLTGGRYTDAVVREDLSILVTAPETNERISVEELSRGTRDQIFLAQRLAIANLLDETGGRAPLLLDDPFAHFDATRLALAVDLLGEMAETRQIVLFSEDERVAELAESAGALIVRLANPAAAPA